MFLLPGDPIDEKVKIIGPGLTRTDCIRSVKAGMLIALKEKAFVDNRQKRYFPAQGDCVVGSVTARIKDGYRVDIGAWTAANLDAMAFEGATKRNRPNLQVGSIVYARVSQADYNVDPEISCINPASGKADGYGVLQDGYVIKVSLDMARKCLDSNFILFKLAEKQFAFELAVGLNGRIWINAENAKQIFIIANLIQQSDGVPTSKIPMIFRNMMKQFES